MKRLPSALRHRRFRLLVGSQLPAPGQRAESRQRIGFGRYPGCISGRPCGSGCCGGSGRAGVGVRLLPGATASSPQVQPNRAALAYPRAPGLGF